MPALRFRGFYDAWEQRKFSEILEYSISNNTLSRANLNYDEGAVKNIHYGDILVKFGSIVDVNQPNVPYVTNGKPSDFTSQLLQNGDVIVADTAEDETTGKAIEVTGITDNYAVSGLHTMVARPNVEFARKYLGYYLNSPSYHNALLPLMQGIKVLSLSKANIAKTVVRFPKDVKEQANIGIFFKQLDNLITQNERKIDLLKQLKQAYLQKIFSQELRFAGFNDDWEERKIVDLFEERSERSPHGQMISITMGSGVVLASSLDRKDNSSFDKSNYKVVRKNDIAYNSMRMWQGASGVSPYNGIVSPAYTIITPKDNVDSGFFAIQFKMAKSLKTFQKYSQGLTSDTWNLKYPALSSIPMITPNFTEQKKINHFFGIFDDLIDKYEKKVLLLKRKKRSYLQKMFV